MSFNISMKTNYHYSCFFFVSPFNPPVIYTWFLLSLQKWWRNFESRVLWRYRVIQHCSRHLRIPFVGILLSFSIYCYLIILVKTHVFYLWDMCIFFISYKQGKLVNKNLNSAKDFRSFLATIVASRKKILYSLTQK